MALIPARPGLQAINYVLSLVRNGGIRAHDIRISQHGDVEKKEVRLCAHGWAQPVRGLPCWQAQEGVFVTASEMRASWCLLLQCA